MRVAIASGYGCSLSWAARLQDEGCDVRLWIDSSDDDDIVHVGDGIVPKENNYDKLVAWCHEDAAHTLLLFDASGMGERADLARKSGLYVVGGGTFCDKLENDREFGQDIALAVGAAIPEYESFDSLSECQRWAKSLGDTGTVFKSDSYIDSDSTYIACSGDDLREYLQYLRGETKDAGHFVVQKLIDGKGADLSTARWWNGRAWIGPYELDIEKKRFMDGNLGKSTGCSLNAVWFDADPRTAKELNWEALTEHFLQNEAPPGIYDINCRIAEDETAYFLEHTPRLGYDSEMTSQRLIGSLCDFLWCVATGQGSTQISSELAYSVRLSIPPYPYEHAHWTDDYSCEGVPVNGVDGLWDGQFIAYQVREKQSGEGYEMASSEGIVGLALAVGDDIHALNDECVAYGKELHSKIPGLQLRTDGGMQVAEDAKNLQALGYAPHPGLVKEAHDAGTLARTS